MIGWGEASVIELATENIEDFTNKDARGKELKAIGRVTGKLRTQFGGRGCFFGNQGNNRAGIENDCL